MTDCVSCHNRPVTEQCAACHEGICDACNAGTSGPLCGSCGIKCGDCGKRRLWDDIGRCSKCLGWFCNGSCMRNCGKCNDQFCKTCMSSEDNPTCSVCS